MFQLNAAEKAEVVANCDHLQKLKFSKVLPYAFTEHDTARTAETAYRVCDAGGQAQGLQHWTRQEDVARQPAAKRRNHRNPTALAALGLQVAFFT